VLELGCFTGERTVEISRIARQATAIDISEDSVLATRQRLAKSGLNATTVFTANAEELPFDDESFDVIFGFGIIHHVDVAKVARQLHRNLRPGGFAIFREPLGHNPLINLYRLVTPRARTPDERPLLEADLASLRQNFLVHTESYFGLTSIGAAILKNTFVGAPTRAICNAIDRALLSIPPFRRYAWQVNLVLQKQPVKGL